MSNVRAFSCAKDALLICMFAHEAEPGSTQLLMTRYGLSSLTFVPAVLLAA